MALADKWTHVVIHHSASVDSDELQIDNFRRWHKQRGWRDIGYHAVIERVEGQYECLFGRPITMTGSHAKRWNRKALGVVFAGNYMDEGPTDEMLRVAVYRVIRPWLVAFSIHKNNIIGHRDTKATDCPGSAFDIQRIRRLI